MAKVGIFLSFEFDRDNDLHRNFYVQAERGDSRHKIIDYSLNEPYRSHDESAWLKKARAKIKQSDIVIVVIGEDTHNAPGVEKEVTIANQLKKPVFQIRPHRRTAGKARGVKKMIPWKWKRIDAMISECFSE
ncbi:MAG: TIR domain-containing protein [Candidatus Poribacteria bacterium]|nr:TIR domain-containing protein [Candidatus Poribacteria bacterium]